MEKWRHCEKALFIRFKFEFAILVFIVALMLNRKPQSGTKYLRLTLVFM